MAKTKTYETRGQYRGSRYHAGERDDERRRHRAAEAKRIRQVDRNRDAWEDAVSEMGLLSKDNDMTFRIGEALASLIADPFRRMK